MSYSLMLDAQIKATFLDFAVRPHFEFESAELAYYVNFCK